MRRNGDVMEHQVDGVLSTLPLKDLIRSLDPPPPQEVLDAADRLRYRDFCLVALMTTEAEPFPDNWIYIHDPGTRAGRVQNFGSWSEDMVVPGTTCLGVEYFCFEGDDVWEMSSEDAVEMAKNEMARIGLIDPDKVIDGVKVRVPKAYPTYDLQYEEAVDTIREYLSGFREPAALRPQRPASLQQPGSFDVDGDPGRVQPRRGYGLRRVVGKHGGGLPRGGRARGRAAGRRPRSLDTLLS